MIKQVDLEVTKLLKSNRLRNSSTQNRSCFDGGGLDHLDLTDNMNMKNQLDLVT